MKIQVLGDDIAYGGVLDTLSDAVKSVGKVAKTTTGKAVIGASLSVLGEKMTPTQKAQLQKFQNEAGIQGTPYNAVSRTPVAMPSMKDSLPYVVIGGAVIIGVIFMLATKKPRV